MNDDAYRDLIEKAHVVRALTQEPGWQVLVEKVARRADERNKWLLDGRAESVEEYRAWAGWVQGAKAILQIPADLDRAVENESKRRQEERAA